MSETKRPSLEQTLYMGLKCIAVMISDLELATRPGVSEREQEIARERVRELARTLQSMG